MTNNPEQPRVVAPIDDGEVFLSAPQVCKRYGGKSHMWLWRKVNADHAFPKPLYLGNDRHWRLSELQAYERGLRRDPAPERVAQVRPKGRQRPSASA